MHEIEEIYLSEFKSNETEQLLSMKIDFALLPKPRKDNKQHWQPINRTELKETENKQSDLGSTSDNSCQSLFCPGTH